MVSVPQILEEGDGDVGKDMTNADEDIQFQLTPTLENINNGHHPHPPSPIQMIIDHVEQNENDILSNHRNESPIPIYKEVVGRYFSKISFALPMLALGIN